jgi:hypothetical protein
VGQKKGTSKAALFFFLPRPPNCSTLRAGKVLAETVVAMYIRHVRILDDNTNGQGDIDWVLARMVLVKREEHDRKKRVSTIPSATLLLSLGIQLSANNETYVQSSSSRFLVGKQHIPFSAESSKHWNHVPLLR